MRAGEIIEIALAALLGLAIAALTVVGHLSLMGTPGLPAWPGWVFAGAVVEVVGCVLVVDAARDLNDGPEVRGQRPRTNGGEHEQVQDR